MRLRSYVVSRHDPRVPGRSPYRRVLRHRSVPVAVPSTDIGKHRGEMTPPHLVRIRILPMTGRLPL